MKNDIGVLKVSFPDQRQPAIVNASIRSGNYSNIVDGLISLNLERYTTSLYGFCVISMAFPYKMIKQYNLIIPGRYARVLIEMYPTIEDANNSTPSKKEVLMDGILNTSKSSFTHDNAIYEIVATDKSMLIAKQEIDPGVNYDLKGNFKTGIQYILDKNGLGKLFKPAEIIAPDLRIKSTIQESKNTFAKDDLEGWGELKEDNQSTTPFGKSVYEYMTSIMNKNGLLLTTIIQDNITKLYFIDSGKIAKNYQLRKVGEAGLNSIQQITFKENDNSSYPYVHSLSHTNDYSKYFDETIILSNPTDDVGAVAEMDMSKINDLNYWTDKPKGRKNKKFVQGYMQIQNTSLGNLKLRQSIDVHSNLSEQSLLQYADWLTKQQISSWMIFEATVSGHYFNNTGSKRIPWILAAPIKVNIDLFDQLKWLGENSIKKIMDEGLILTGYRLKYTVEDNIKTTLYMVPSPFVDLG